MEAPYTCRLAEYISGSRFEALPKDVVAHAKLLILDTIGVGVYGASLPWSERLRATAEAIEAPGRVSVWCTPLAFSAPTAAMINATAVHAFELDDVGPGGHNGSVTLSSALAMAEQRGKLSGAGLLNSVVVGIETAARVAGCVGRTPREGLGFHDAGLIGAFASVATSSRALELSPDDVVHALGHAGQQTASLMFTHHGGMGKRLLAGQAARAGTFGALLAQNGFTNAPNVFEAEYGGFCAAHTGNRQPPAYDLTELTKDLGALYYTPKIRFRMFAEQLTDEKIRDPRALEMVERISVTDHPSMDGTRHADVVDKFRKITRRYLTGSAQEEIIGLCERLETLDDVGSLISALFWGRA